MKVAARNFDDGVELEIDNKKYAVHFPAEVWKDYPDNLKDIYFDNYAFLKSIHLPQMLDLNEEIDFETSYPIFQQSIYNCMMNNVPFSADVDGASTAKNLKKFINLEFNYNDFEVKFPNYSTQLDEKAVLTFSMGKDSLLTYGLADEIGLEPAPIFSVDNSVMLENKYKLAIAKKFSDEFKRKIWVVQNNTSVIHDYRYWNLPRTEWGYGHLITELFYNMLPFANHLKAKYLLFGNEKSCDDFYINSEGFKSYPVYDQSSDWLIELTNMAKYLTKSQARVVSFIEPIYELAVMKVLHSRYPEIGKYQMSCFPDENEYGKKHYWCQHCSKCARIFIFMKANDIDPKIVGFNEDMLKMEFKNLYSAFGVEKKEGASVGYDTSGLGRDEQLYAFYLAYKNGAKGELIDLFKKNYLDEAKQREDEFHNTFFGIHQTKTIPKKFINQLHSIYKEELQ